MHTKTDKKVSFEDEIHSWQNLSTDNTFEK